MLIHEVTASDPSLTLDHGASLVGDWGFLCELRDIGRAAPESWPEGDPNDRRIALAWPHVDSAAADAIERDPGDAGLPQPSYLVEIRVFELAEHSLELVEHHLDELSLRRLA